MQPLSLRLQPEPKILSAKVVRIAQELAPPRRHRLRPTPRRHVAFERGDVELESAGGEADLVLVGVEPGANDPPQLEQHLTERLPRFCGISLTPEQIGQLSPADGSRRPSSQVGQQRQPYAGAGEPRGRAAVEAELTERAQDGNGVDA
jgi:hypothetical protein